MRKRRTEKPRRNARAADVWVPDHASRGYAAEVASWNRRLVAEVVEVEVAVEVVAAVSEAGVAVAVEAVEEDEGAAVVVVEFIPQHSRYRNNAHKVRCTHRMYDKHPQVSVVVLLPSRCPHQCINAP